jgi:potassium-dependent mechanosensitive channel
MNLPRPVDFADAGRRVRWAFVGLLLSGLASAMIAQPAAPSTAELVADTAVAMEREREALRQLHKAQEGLERSMQRIGRRAEVHAQGREFSQAVIDQLRQLPRAEQLRLRESQRERTLETTSDANLRVADQLAALDDLGAVVAKRLDARSPPLPPEQRAQAEAELREQLSAERRMLSGLDEMQRDLIGTLLALNKAEEELLRRSSVAHEELSRLLFWVPARPGREAIGELGPSLAWMGATQHWQQAGTVLRDQAGRPPYTPALTLLAAIGLGLIRRRLQARLLALAPLRLGVEHYRAAHTVQALLVSLALALPGPLLLWSLSGWLARAPDVQSFPLALGDALAPIAVLWLGMSSFAWLLRPGGVVVSHFGWDDVAMGFSERALRVFMALFLPLMFVAALNGLDHAPFSNRESLGRIAFILAMGLLSGFMYVLLRRSAPPMQRLLARAPRGWAVKWHGVWFAGLLAVPIGMALLGLVGYFVAAGYFFGRLTMTLVLVLGAVLLYGLMAQWVQLQRARLARQRRALEGQARTEAAEGTPQALPTPRIDIATLGEQTRSLFDMLITLLLLIGVWLIWKDAVPVLSVIGDYTLWTYSDTVDGKETTLPLTVGHLFLTLLIAAVTALMMRNIGAMLDMVLLQRLEMQADATYAIKVVARYLIAAAGIVAASKVLGIRWTDVHWLVAALGVGLGFGLQEIFANFVSGLIVLAERPIRIGDVVTVGGVTGTVSRIRARATSVIDFDNKEVIIPNKAFITEQVVNWTLSNQTTRLLIKVGVAYGSDVAAVQALLLGAVRLNPDVLGEPEPSVYFVGFGESALDFEVRVYVDAFGKRLRVQHEINLAVQRALAASGIEIPFPQRDLHLRTGPWPAAGVPAARA